MRDMEKEGLTAAEMPLPKRRKTFWLEQLCPDRLKRHIKAFVMRGGIFCVPGERTFLFHHLEKFAKGMSSKRILDMGAGLGQYGYLFREKNIYETCDMHDGFHPGLKHDIVAEIYDIPVQSGTYDVALMLQVLEHLEFPVKGLTEIGRILKEDGVLFLSVPQAAGDHFVPHHYFNYTQYGLKSVLAQAGFEVIEYHRLDGIFTYVGNRIGKLGSILYDQYRAKGNIMQRLISLPVFGLCWLLGRTITLFDFLDKERNYCLGHIVIARKKGV